MTHWTTSVVAILLGERAGELRRGIQGPARTDCYLALSQFYRAQSDLAANQSACSVRRRAASGNYRHRPAKT
jgi:hypothetical protein